MKLKPIVLGISIMALAGATAHAEDRAKQTAQAQPKASQQPMQQQSAQAGQPAQGQKTLRASELIGKKVVDTRGKDLGEIEEVVFDLNSGRVRAAVLNVGGFLGIGDKQVAIPMGEIKRGQGGKFTANLDKKKLEDAEGFAKGQMPGMNDEYWARTASASGSGGQSSRSGSPATANGGKSSAGASSGQPSQGMNLVRASEMEGRNVQDRSGNAIGEVRNVVINLTDGKVEHIVVDMNDAGQARIPANAFSSGTGDKLVVNMSREQLASRSAGTREARQLSRGEAAQPSAVEAQRSSSQPQERPRS